MHTNQFAEEPVLRESGMLKRALAWLDEDLAFENISHAIEAHKKTGQRKLLSLCVPVEVSDPLSVLELIPPSKDFRYYWEKPNDQFALAAFGNIESFSAKGIHRFENVQQWSADVKKNHYRASMIKHRHANLFMLGGFSFLDQSGEAEWKGFKAAQFVIPKWVIIRDGQLRLVVVNIKIEDQNFKDVTSLKEHASTTLSGLFGMLEMHRKRMREFKEENAFIEYEAEAKPLTINDNPNDYQQWVNGINKAKEMIDQGYFEKIVLARKVQISMENPIRLTHVAHALRKTYPECTTYFISLENEKSIIGSTPEILASFKPNYILTEALAGTIKRGKTASEDEMYEQKLLESVKDLKEHAYVVDAIKLQLSRFVHQVDVADSPTIKKLNNVQHLYTPITAWKDRPVSTMSVIHAMHPTPAVGGAPNGKAVKYIRQFENFDRGWYAGPVGWINLSDEADFQVAIRSALIDGNSAYLYAGCGIVANSDAELEWKEANLKLIPMLSALKDL